jgi:hypothetical protein
VYTAIYSLVTVKDIVNLVTVAAESTLNVITSFAATVRIQLVKVESWYLIADESVGLDEAVMLSNAVGL